jgi:radical SAM superfamily enzyme YgiQ (UPF0313 family)
MNSESITGPIRPPSEARSLLIRVTNNCPWNRCEFCSVFKGQKFQRRRVDDVKEDILTARKAMEYVQEWSEKTGQRPGYVARLNGIPWLHDGGVKSAFLQDSDSLTMKTESLVEILNFLRETFPTIERICTYARGKTLFRKDLDELKHLREAGLSRLHIGLETGDDELLAYIKKGATAYEMVKAGRKALDGGYEVSEYIMPGLGGRERWEQHALNSARVLNEINPHFIRLRTFYLIAGTPIFEKAKRGEFHMQSIEGVLIEIRRFIEELNVSSELITSDFAFNYYLGELDGKLPEDKKQLLELVDDALAGWHRRGEPKSNPFWGSLNRSDKPLI